jgi:hypothetical protein
LDVVITVSCILRFFELEDRILVGYGPEARRI